jgi:hypothetical protein
MCNERICCRQSVQSMDENVVCGSQRAHKSWKIRVQLYEHERLSTIDDFRLVYDKMVKISHIEFGLNKCIFKNHGVQAFYKGKSTIFKAA